MAWARPRLQYASGGDVHPGVRVADHGRYVVVDDEPVEADGVQPPDDPGGVEVALTQEAFAERGDGSLYVAEVDVEDRALDPEGVDDLVDRCFATHLRDGPQAEVEPPGGTAVGLPAGPQQRGRGGEDAGGAAQRHVDRRVVGVQGCSATGRTASRKYWWLAHISSALIGSASGSVGVSR